MAERRLRRRQQPSDSGSVAFPTEPRFLIIGRISRPHGVAGEVNVAVMTDTPQRFEWLERVFLATDPDDPSPTPVAVAGVRWHGDRVLLKLDGYDDRDAVAALRASWLLVPLAEAVPLAEGEYFLYQLLGLAVKSTEGHNLGHVADLLETGANHVLVIRGDYGEVLVPNVPAVVMAIDFAERLITVQLIPGLLPNPSL